MLPALLVGVRPGDRLPAGMAPLFANNDRGPALVAHLGELSIAFPVAAVPRAHPLAVLVLSTLVTAVVGLLRRQLELGAIRQFEASPQSADRGWVYAQVRRHLLEGHAPAPGRGERCGMLGEKRAQPCLGPLDRILPLGEQPVNGLRRAADLFGERPDRADRGSAGAIEEQREALLDPAGPSRLQGELGLGARIRPPRSLSPT